MNKKPTYEELEQRVKGLEKEVVARGRLEERLRLLSLAIAQSSEGIAVVDLNGNLRILNKVFANMHGYSPEELIGKNLSIFHTPQQMPSVEAANRQIKETGDFKGEIWHAKRNGAVFPTMMHNSLIRDTEGNPIGMIGTLRDISEKKRAEKELMESEEKFRLITEQNLFGIIIIQDDIVKYVNNAASEITEYSIEEALCWGPNEFGKLFHPDDFEFVMEQAQKKQKGTKDVVISYSYRIITKSGKVKWIDQYSNTISYSGKSADLITILDITDRKLAKKALRENERKYRTLASHIPGMIYRGKADWSTEIIFNSEIVCGYSVDEFNNHKVNWSDLIHPDDKQLVLEEGYKLQKKPLSIVQEYRIFHKDESTRWVNDHKTSFFKEDGSFIFVDGVVYDITERKRALEEREKLQQLFQSMKMDAIGSLAGGIAHEFNNILAIIIGNTELAIDDIPERNPARSCLKEIQSASSRAKDSVRKLLGFARKSVIQLQSVHLSPVIREAMILIRASIPATIEIHENISCESDMVMADSSQIEAVLLNLCANAKNAMQEEGGVLEVRLENTTLDEKSAARYEGLGPGNYVKMTVRDTGHGIDPKIIGRIFEPYFTTGSLAEATGMGLAVVHGVVKHHSGAIVVKSEPGKGTVFEVLLPITETEAEQKSGEPEALPTGNETILFVDDEASLLKLAKRRLEMHEYRVETKSDPVDALELFRSGPDRFNLIITDMSMPKMTGDKLAKEALSIRPDMPIILCSGFSEKIDAEKAKELGIRKYIEKPLNMSDFVVAVRKVLDEVKDLTHD